MDYKDKIDVLMKFWRRKGSPNAKDTLFFGWKFKITKNIWTHYPNIMV